MEFCEWESRFFGFEIANCYLDLANKQNAERIVKDYFSCDASMLRISFEQDKSLQQRMTELGFYHVDDLNTFELQLGNKRYQLLERKLQDVVESPLTFGRLNAHHLNAFQSFGQRLFTDSKYYFDDKFDNSRVDQMYIDWFSKSVSGNFDDYVMGVSVGSELLAFASIKSKSEKVANIGLFAVNPNYQGRGIGSAFLRELTRYMLLEGYEALLVATQARNSAAIKLYKRSDFILKKIITTMHIWKPANFGSKS